MFGFVPLFSFYKKMRLKLTDEMGEIEFLKFILLIAQDLKTMYIMCHVFSRKFKFIRLLDITHFLDLKSDLEASLTFITH